MINKNPFIPEIYRIFFFILIIVNTPILVYDLIGFYFNKIK